MVEITENFDLKKTFDDYRNVFLDTKKYWLIYLLFIALTTLSTFTKKNMAHPKFTLIAFALIAVVGVFCILFYFLHNSDEELHKVAFVIILLFGIICAMVVPIVFHIDELEHFTRSELTSHGELIPHWVGDEFGIHTLYNHTSENKSTALNHGVGFYTIGSMKFFEKFRAKTVLATDHDTDKINHTPYLRGSAFEQNPFYGYLPQAIGIAVAKLLDMNVIWMLWLGRIFNLIFFAFMAALAVKITPCLKMPMIAVSCLPVTIYHAASVSIDSMFFALGILAVAYFLYLHQSGENTIENKHLVMFSALCLLLGLCKLPFLAFIFLLLFIPKMNFKNDNILPFIILSILIVAVCGVLWSRYSTPALMHSWRSSLNQVNASQQLNYLLNNPSEIFKFIQQSIGISISDVLNELINFDYRNKASLSRYAFIIMAVEVFTAVILLTYPQKVKFDLKTRLGAFLVFAVIYMGTFFVQLLTWEEVGQMYVGVHIRYFIPLLALIPIFIQLNFSGDENASRFDRYTYVFIIGFMATLIMALVTRFY